MDLKDAGNGRYEGTYNEFHLYGSYDINVYAKDTNGNIALPKSTSVYQKGGNTTPSPNIKANDSEGTLDINEGDQLSMAVSLDPGSYSGTSADWYIVVNTPSGWQSFDISQMDYSTSGLSASLQDYGLFSLGPTKIFSTTGLSAGAYTYYFAVYMNGQFYFDSVTVNVQ